MDNQWQIKVLEFCKEFNVPTEYLSDILYDLKVTPMIRGKAFEYSAMLALRSILPSDKWEISKPYLNPQLGSHDMDISIRDKESGKIIRVECKLAGKQSFRISSEGKSSIQVKCMRSRTLGASMVANLSGKWGISRDALAVHNDQYLPDVFDVVITSLGNAFYRTNPDSGVYEWSPTEKELTFLEHININKEPNLKDFAFNKMYVASSHDLVASKLQTVCRRKKCPDKNNCPFIPNYPKISFDVSSYKPINGWVELENSKELFEKLLQ